VPRDRGDPEAWKERRVNRHGEAQRQREDGVRQHGVGQVERVHDRLHDLQHRDGDDSIAQQHAEHAPALHLGDQFCGVQEEALSFGAS
jgi:hypothetical protein